MLSGVVIEQLTHARVEIAWVKLVFEKLVNMMIQIPQLAKFDQHEKGRGSIGEESNDQVTGVMNSKLPAVVEISATRSSVARTIFCYRAMMAREVANFNREPTGYYLKSNCNSDFRSSLA